MKRTISIILTLALLICSFSCFCVQAADAEYTLITKPTQLLLIKENPDANYKLGADIDMSEIFLTEPLAETFSGTLDGDGYTIKNIDLCYQQEYFSLFKTVTGTIQNIRIQSAFDVNCNKTVYVGILAINLSGGTIQKVICDVKYNVKSANAWVGGIAAYVNSTSHIKNCQVKGSISCEPLSENNFCRVGGITSATTTLGTEIKNCTSDVDITAKNNKASSFYAAGIIASSQYQTTVTECKNTGDIEVLSSGASYAGGISAIAANNTSVSRSENRGNVSAAISDDGYEAYAGGISADISGGASGGNISNCANYGDIYGQSAGAGIVAKFYGRALKYNFSCPDAVIGGTELDRICVTFFEGNDDYTASKEYNYTSLKESYPGFNFNTIWTWAKDYPVLRYAGIREIPVKATLHFTDVPDGEWFTEPVKYAYDHGIFNGTSATTFSPEGHMTRAQFVMVLANLSGVHPSINIETDFSDVPQGQWYTGVVNWAAEIGITSGIGEGKFGPDITIDREQMCSLLVRYLRLYRKEALTNTSDYKFADDSEISEWAKNDIYICKEAGLVSGIGYDKFAPKGIVDRKAGATLFKNFHLRYIA